MQIFSHNPRQWKQSIISTEEAELFRSLRKKYDISPVFVHVSYLINLASLSDTIFRKSIDLLSYEIRNASMIGAEYVVLHTGSASGQDEDSARKRAAGAIRKACGSGGHSTSIILENTAGERGDITSSITSLAEILNRCGPDIVAGICVDTCHAFSSGYDIRTVEGTERMVHEIEKYAGTDKVRLLHLNDSRKPCGSGVDRHEHIGKGYIGIRGFRNLLSHRKFSGIPMVLETPKKNVNDDRINLSRIKRILRT